MDEKRGNAVWIVAAMLFVLPPAAYLGSYAVVPEGTMMFFSRSTDGTANYIWGHYRYGGERVGLHSGTTSHLSAQCLSDIPTPKPIAGTGHTDG